MTIIVLPPDIDIRTKDGVEIRISAGSLCQSGPPDTPTELRRSSHRNLARAAVGSAFVFTGADRYGHLGEVLVPVGLFLSFTGLLGWLWEGAMAGHQAPAYRLPARFYACQILPVLKAPSAAWKRFRDTAPAPRNALKLTYEPRETTNLTGGRNE